MPTYVEIRHLLEVADMYFWKGLDFVATCFGLWLSCFVISRIVIRCGSWAFARLAAVSRRAWRSSPPACRRWAESFLAWSKSL